LKLHVPTYAFLHTYMFISTSVLVRDNRQRSGVKRYLSVADLFEMVSSYLPEPASCQMCHNVTIHELGKQFQLVAAYNSTRTFMKNVLQPHGMQTAI